MMGSTHQLIALAAALWLLTLYPISLGPVAGVVAVVAVMVGALTPDLDQPAANLWRRMLAGRAIGNIFQWFSGGHRHFTHSLIGIIIVGVSTRWAILELINSDYTSQTLAVWLAFMVGYISHPLADTLTDRGVPWLWPLHLNIKIPPGPEEVRVTTDSIVEKVLVRGGAVAIIILLLMRDWPAVFGFFQ